MMRVHRSRSGVLALLAVASLVLSGCGFQGLYSASLPGGADLGDHPITIVAHFDDVLDLVPQSAVKVNDIAEGKVTKISLDGWKAKVTMQVNSRVSLPANARAEVNQTSLLGEKYVALEQPLGAPSTSKLKSGADIPLSRTRSAPEVEQVLGALSLLLNQGGVEQIQVIARELNTALKGNESAIRSLIGQLNTFVGTLNGQRDKITTALDDVNTLAATLNRQQTVLTDALDTYPAALAVLSQERGKLTTLLSSLSRLGTVATSVITATQADFVSALKSLSQPLKQLTASGANLPKALRIAGTFPFPLGRSREFVKGDYANLSAILNLNLTDQLCGALGSQLPLLCTTKSPTLPTLPTVAGANSSSSKKLQPQLIGTGK
ncbi:MCE family protein [uncultured Jatrophihabitans sp.]|uniref:MCE family protein n=1 Tax=uncultured Jatrophihabitans sp. TaxID=1610747 RepID=UPI0035C9C546